MPYSRFGLVTAGLLAVLALPHAGPGAGAGEATAGPKEKKKWTYSDAQRFGRLKQWKQLREMVLHAKDGSAWNWAVSYYVMYQPRWTAAHCVERFRAWLKAHPEPTQKQLDAWDNTFRENVAPRDKRLCARLGADLLASENDRLARLGCDLLRWAGDRHADRALLTAGLKRSPTMRSKVLHTLARLRRPGPLPTVSDEELCNLVKKMASAPKMVQSEYGLYELPAVLPDRFRASLWHTFFKVFRLKKRPWRYPNGFYENYRDKPAWPPSEAERKVVRSYLKGSDPDMRGWAGYYLAKWQDVPSAPDIVRLLGDHDADVREMVANGISWHSTPAYVPALRPLLQDKNKDVVAAAAGAIGICGDRKSVPQLVALLDHKDIHVVSRAAAGLRGNRHVIGNAEVRTKLKGLLKVKSTPNGKWHAYSTFAWALSALCTREDLPAVKSAAKLIPDEDILKRAQDRMDPEGALRRKLRKEAGNTKGWQRLFAAHRGDKKAAAEICAALKPVEGTGSINFCVLTCLRALYFDQREIGVKQTRELLHWDRSWISEVPAHAAGRFKDKRLTAELCRAIRRSDVSLGTRIWALGEIGDRKAVPALLEVGLDPRWVVKVTHRRDAYPTPWYKGYESSSDMFLAEVTAAALAKITGHEIIERDPVKLAAAWRKRLAAEKK